MGYSCTLFVDDYPMTSDRSDVNPYIMALFDADDLKIFDRKVSERNRLAWCVTDEDSDNEKATVFESSAGIVRDRLQVLGFTYNRAKEDFRNSAADTDSLLESILDRATTVANDEIRIKRQLLQEKDYDAFLNCLKYIFNHKIQEDDVESYKQHDDFPLLSFLLDRCDPMDNFPYSDLRNVLRGLLESLPPNTTVKYDITEHLYSELYEEPDINSHKIYKQLIEEDELTFEDKINEKIIVITEGSSDAAILRKSLKTLYPHLSKYYWFMDFDTATVPGGSGLLVNYTKSFIGSGISSRIISLFDNDTAGYSAAKLLSKLSIPNNFRILHLPDIELADNYPTIGPTGLMQSNINRAACSIELYLGRDVLVANGSLCPVQWTGYDKGLQKYQGEIIDKSIVQERFFRKVKLCERDSKLIPSYEWTEMRQLLQLIFNAFNC